jgi:hypothetical protein
VDSALKILGYPDPRRNADKKKKNNVQVDCLTILSVSKKNIIIMHANIAINRAICGGTI